MTHGIHHMQQQHTQGTIRSIWYACDETCKLFTEILLQRFTFSSVQYFNECVTLPIMVKAFALLPCRLYFLKHSIGMPCVFGFSNAVAATFNAGLMSMSMTSHFKIKASKNEDKKDFYLLVIHAWMWMYWHLMSCTQLKMGSPLCWWWMQTPLWLLFWLFSSIASAVDIFCHLVHGTLAVYAHSV